VLALPKNEEDLTAFTTQAIASQVLNQHMLVAADRPAPWKSTDTLRVQAGTSQGHPRQFSTQTEAQSPVAALGSIDPAQKSRTEQRFYDLQDVVLTPSHLWRTAVSRLEADPTTAIETALTQRPTSLFDMPHQATERALWPNAIHYATAKHAGLKQVFETAQSTVVFRPLAMASAVEEHDHGQSFALLDSVECQTVGGGHMVALVGCDGLRVVTSEDATLVTRNETPEAPSDLIDAMKARRHVALQSAASVEHNWGRMQTVAEQNGHRLVQLSVEPTSSTPMEVHMRRTEFWYVLAGYGLARVGGTLIALEPGSRLDIPPRVPHAITNSGDMPLVIMEARRGEMLGNNDTYPAEIEPDAITEFA
ncbi:MAG: cupin domain-containing protein, partial [Pseudomonadota bacterium]